jgi:CheY-like chemotaxis protein
VVNKMLLADDSITMQKLVELILAEEGFEIMSTNNGEEALAAIPSFQPNIVLADVEMPKINGYQLCDKIKQNPSTSRLPVILLAGAFEQFDEELAKKVMADDFIIKPFESQELIGKVHAALAVSSVKEESAGVPAAPEVIPEEDLWAMEEISETPKTEAGTVAGKKDEIVLEEAIQPVAEKPAEAKVIEIELPSKDELKEIFEKNVRDKITESLSSLNIKESIVNSYVPQLRDSIADIKESIINSYVPQLRESIIDTKESLISSYTPQLKESIIDIKEGVLTSITPVVKDSVEKVVSETVSNLAEEVLRDSMKVAIESILNRAEKEIIEIIPSLTEKVLSDTLSKSLDPIIKEADKAMSDTLPYLFDKMLRDELKDTFESLPKEIEKVVWKTVPDLAEAIISKEIERIRSEF